VLHQVWGGAVLRRQGGRTHALRRLSGRAGCGVELADTPIQFVALYPGFTLTPGIDPAVVPHPALMIDIERAVAEILGAIGRGDEHHIFPKRIRGVMGFGRALPEPMRRWILKKAR
jgi:hypothetical protein